MMADDLPKSIARDTLNVMGVTLVVHVLDDGRRIIEGDGLQNLFAAMSNSTMTMSQEEADVLAGVVRGRRA